MPGLKSWTERARFSAHRLRASQDNASDEESSAYSAHVPDRRRKMAGGPAVRSSCGRAILFLRCGLRAFTRRPSCPARLARRENVRFHATTAEAEKAGFRACKRCKPKEAPLHERQAAADLPRRAVESRTPPSRLRWRHWRMRSDQADFICTGCSGRRPALRPKLMHRDIVPIASERSSCKVLA